MANAGNPFVDAGQRKVVALTEFKIREICIAG